MLSIFKSLLVGNGLEELLKDKLSVKLHHLDIKEISKWNVLQCIELDLSFCSLDTIPKGVFSVFTIETLILSSNKINTISNDIVQLTHLTKIDLSANSITHFPLLFHNLPSLTFLNLSNNAIYDISNDIIPIPSLCTLQLNNTLLTSFPTVFGSFPKLETLELDYCKFRIIQNNELEGFQNLKYLSLKSTTIITLPSTISTLKNLERLIIGTNKMPSEIVELKNLKDIHLYLPEKSSRIDCGLDCIINIHQYFESIEPYLPQNSPIVEFKLPILLNQPMLDLSNLPIQFVSNCITIFRKNSFFLRFFAENDNLISVLDAFESKTPLPDIGFTFTGNSKISIDKHGNIWIMWNSMSKLFENYDIRQTISANLTKNDFRVPYCVNTEGKLNFKTDIPENISLQKVITLRDKTCGLDIEGNIWILYVNRATPITFVEKKSEIVDIHCNINLLCLHADGSISEVFYNNEILSSVDISTIPTGSGITCNLILYDSTLPPVSSIWCKSGEKSLHLIDRKGTITTKINNRYHTLQGTPPNIVEIATYKFTDFTVYFVDENRNIYEYDTITKETRELYLPIFLSSRVKSARK